MSTVATPSHHSSEQGSFQGATVFPRELGSIKGALPSLSVLCIILENGGLIECQLDPLPSQQPRKSCTRHSLYEVKAYEC